MKWRESIHSPSTSLFSCCRAANTGSFALPASEQFCKWLWTIASLNLYKAFSFNKCLCYHKENFLTYLLFFPLCSRRLFVHVNSVCLCARIILPLSAGLSGQQLSCVQRLHTDCWEKNEIQWLHRKSIRRKIAFLFPVYEWPDLSELSTWRLFLNITLKEDSTAFTQHVLSPLW